MDFYPVVVYLISYIFAIPFAQIALYSLIFEL